MSLMTNRDNLTNAGVVITQEHHEVHEGDHFFIADYLLGAASGAIIEFVITTPPGDKHAHAVVTFSGSEGATLQVYVGSTSVVGGATVTPVNNDGNSSDTSVLTIIKDPTSITPGTRVTGFLAGGGRTAGFNSRDKEVILQADTTYLFRFTSLAVANDIGYEFEWYEHTDRRQHSG